MKIHLPDAEFVLNEVKPRSQSFEVNLEVHEKRFLIWSGRTLKPRKNKFPEPEFIMESMNKFFDVEAFSA